MTITADTHEPVDIIRFIEQVMPVAIADLNGQGMADYYWTGESVAHWPGHNGTYHVERKTWQDLAGGIEAIEDQLRRQRQEHPLALQRLVIEGAIEPHPSGVAVYTRASGKSVMVPRVLGRPGMYKSIMGKVAGWYEFLDVYPTASYPSTAALLVELYQRDQKPEEERETFRKHYKQINWRPNKQVERLLGLASNDSGLGVELCEALIGKFGTVWAVIHASPQEIAKIHRVSENMARQFLRKIGRLDV